VLSHRVAAPVTMMRDASLLVLRKYSDAAVQNGRLTPAHAEAVTVCYGWPF
jgi:hypothetical protein